MNVRLAQNVRNFLTAAGTVRISKCFLILRRVCKFVKSDYELRHIYLSGWLSAWKYSAPTGRIFMKFDVSVLFVNLLRMFRFHENLTRITGTLHEYQYVFLIVSLWVVIRMRNSSDKACRNNQNTHFVFGKWFFFENHVVYKVMWKYVVKPGWPQTAV